MPIAGSSATAAAPPSEVDVLVVGAGLAGLCAALELSRAGHTVHVVEASDGVGGRVQTDHVDGWTLDRGFQILLTAYPEVRRQIDLDALDTKTFTPGAQIFADGSLYRVGDPLRDLGALLPTLRSPIGGLRDKLAIVRLRQRVLSGDARDLLRARDQSTADHLAQLGFSQRMIDRFLGPLFTGIQLDPKLETSSRMFDIIFRSLSEGDAVVPAAGMGAIPAQLAARLGGEHITLQCPVTSVIGATATSGPAVNTVHGTIVAQHVVVATEAPAAAELLGLTVPGSRHVGCVWFGADQSPSPQTKGARGAIMLDGSDSGPAHNVAVLSDVAPSYAPPGRTLIAAACAADTDADLDQRVRTQLRGWFGPSVNGWETLRVDRIAHAQPNQAPPFNPKRSVRLGDGVWVCGDHRDTGSIQGAMHSGRRTGQAVAAELVER